MFFDVDDLRASFGKGASYPVGHKVGAQVAHVGVAVNGGAASVDAGYAGSTVDIVSTRLLRVLYMRSNGIPLAIR